MKDTLGQQLISLPNGGHLDHIEIVKQPPKELPNVAFIVHEKNTDLPVRHCCYLSRAVGADLIKKAAAWAATRLLLETVDSLRAMLPTIAGQAPNREPGGVLPTGPCA